MTRSVRLSPKGRFDTEFVHALYQATKVMSKNFTKSFVDLRRARLASQTVAKLSLDHMERRLDVGSLVIALHEASLIVRIEMEHPLPNCILRVGLAGRDTVALERDVRHRGMVNNGLEIVTRKISFVG